MQVVQCQLPPLPNDHNNQENTTKGPKKIPLHFIPCSIAYSGPADISRYFHPEEPKDYYENLDKDGKLIPKPQPTQQYQPLQATFRGHQVHGTKHPLPPGTIGVILENTPNQTTTNPTPTPTTSSSIEQPTPLQAAQTTAIRKRPVKRSKQDDLFDEFDPDGDINEGLYSQIANDAISSQIQQTDHRSSSAPITSNTSPPSGSFHNGSNDNPNLKTVQITAVFDEIHFWDPEIPEDIALFQYRRQAIEELIPLANALHSHHYDSDDE
jgi:hypothetical protein